jgi:ABC-type arginine transport system permease subunit
MMLKQIQTVNGPCGAVERGEQEAGHAQGIKKSRGITRL